MPAFGGDACARKLDRRAGVEQRPTALEAVVPALVKKRQQVDSCCEATAPDVEHVVVRLEPFLSEELELPESCRGPVATRSDAMRRLVEVRSVSSFTSRRRDGYSDDAGRGCVPPGKTSLVMGQSLFDIAVKGKSALLEYAHPATNRADRSGRMGHEQQGL